MYEDIKQQFKEVIRYSQGISEPQIDKLFWDWSQAKKKFIERFGGLIYEWPIPIEFTLDDKEKRYRAMDFANCVYDTFNNPVLAEFIDENLDSFFENKVTKTVENSEIPHGMKLIKAFKFFEFNKKTLRSIQDMASQLIQENKIKGTLCFSVHPLDFLSSSENTYNWRSCHALDGEYRAGNLSYMVDTTTFMVYLKGADDVVLPDFPPEVHWNSKKWRMLIHAAEDDEIIFAGRQYPFSSKSGIDTVLNIYNNIMTPVGSPFYGALYKYGTWRADYIDSYVPYDAPADSAPKELNAKYLIIDHKLIGLDLVVKEGYQALNYNDILHSSCYLYPYYSIFNPYAYHNIEHIKRNPIIVGGEVYCLHCGERTITDGETMRCNDCELEYGTEENDQYGSCACCGARIYLDDAYIAGDEEELICDGCFQSQCFICDGCEGTYYREDRHYISLGDEDRWYCHHCYEEYKERLRGLENG